MGNETMISFSLSKKESELIFLSLDAVIKGSGADVAPDVWPLAQKIRGLLLENQETPEKSK